MSKKTWKNMTLRSGKLAWRVGVLAMTIAALLAAKLVRLLIGSGIHVNQVNERDSIAFIDPDTLMTEQEAWVAFDRGQIGAAEMNYYSDPYGDGLGS